MTQHTLPAVTAALVALTIALASGPRDAGDDQTEENRNSQSVITLPIGGPVTVF